ncbi:MAG: hypothetical protein ACR2ND_09375 [Solirubrobacteraceae bacterium]
MTMNATIRPIHIPVAARGREDRADELAELLGTLADLTAHARRRRERLERLEGGDPRVRAAVASLASLERHAHEVGVEAASVHHELQHSRLI